MIHDSETVRRLLERDLIERSEDPELRLIWADLLQLEGDPLGTLVVLDHVGASSNTPRAVAERARAEAEALRGQLHARRVRLHNPILREIHVGEPPKLRARPAGAWELGGSQVGWATLDFAAIQVVSLETRPLTSENHVSLARALWDGERARAPRGVRARARTRAPSRVCARRARVVSTPAVEQERSAPARDATDRRSGPPQRRRDRCSTHY